MYGSGAVAVDVEMADCHEIFGPALYEDPAWAPEVNPVLATNLEEIVKDGIPKKSLHDLRKKFSTPINCPLLSPPKRNRIFDTVLPKDVISKDNDLSLWQRKSASALSAISKI
ncbi:hypothetical protein DMENIID0001_125330 [Sergentomyia squamirostris]